MGWEVIHTQAGAGDSNETIEYYANDTDPPSGRVYYRLRQIDYDGQYSLSAIQVVEIEAATDTDLTVYPNPASNHVTVRSASTLSSLKLFNVRGVEVTNKITISRQGDSTYSATLDALPAGVYFFSTDNGSTRLYKN